MMYVAIDATCPRVPDPGADGAIGSSVASGCCGAAHLGQKLWGSSMPLSCIHICYMYWIIYVVLS